MEFTQIKWKEVQGAHVESEEFNMDMRARTIGNGVRSALWSARSAAGSGKTVSGLVQDLMKLR